MLVRVLFVEDVETDAELAVRRLRTDGVPCTFERVETEAAGLEPAVTRALREAEQQNERAAQRARIERLTRILEMLSGINTAVVRIRERLELLQEACRIAVTTGHYVTALVALIEPGTRGARPVSWAGKGGEQMSSLVFSIAASEEEDSSVTGRALRTGEVFLCNDIARADRIVAGFSTLRGAEFQSIVALPLKVDATTVGALTLTAQDRDAITDEELNLLGELAANLSFALQYFEKESAVQFLSYFNSLTGLAKRVLFCERLATRLTARKAEEPQPAVAIIDIEHLSIINDSYGRHAGDHLLTLIDAEALVQNAEAGLRQAKAAGEQYHHHRLDLSSKLAARLALEHRLRGALDNDRYLLYYRPKIDIATGELDGVEALLRWDDPERGIVGPGEFLPILESTGMIVSVGEWALHHFLERAGCIQSQGFLHAQPMPAAALEALLAPKH